LLRWARLLADLRTAGRAMPVKDSFIAAAALGRRVARRSSRIGSRRGDARVAA
jgi:predicted nucleic acid-binding protein